MSRSSGTLWRVVAAWAMVAVPIILLLVVARYALRLQEPYACFEGVLFIATALNEHAGINIWLARLIAVPLVVVGYYCGIRYIVFVPKCRGWGLLSLVAVWCFVCACMYVTHGNFSRRPDSRGGAVAQKYYFEDDDGRIILRDHDGIDAVVGKKLRPVTPEVIREYHRQQKGGGQRVDGSQPNFVPQERSPLRRYHIRQSFKRYFFDFRNHLRDKLEIFPFEIEFHPRLGVPLAELTPAIARRYPPADWVMYTKPPKGQEALRSEPDFWSVNGRFRPGVFFDPDTGAPLRRYFQNGDGEFRLFRRNVELHPELGIRLDLMTPEVARQLDQQINDYQNGRPVENWDADGKTIHGGLNYRPRWPGRRL